ncbi:hypothetical protein BD310DRAFT_386735 [Dichomitus squalens]|uniref:Uncharacterized protein n=1 Tax=Dichomitus squalens TaxID=114155 RepID=A0A4Q9PY94_9APHY|nr:hypothetical protein BD310DRAFT_386735 [Dichomitus squalens]
MVPTISRNIFESSPSITVRCRPMSTYPCCRYPQRPDRLGLMHFFHVLVSLSLVQFLQVLVLFNRIQQTPLQLYPPIDCAELARLTL